jgi:hypothetical protein
MQLPNHSNYFENLSKYNNSDDDGIESSLYLYYLECLSSTDIRFECRQAYFARLLPHGFA